MLSRQQSENIRNNTSRLLDTINLKENKKKWKYSCLILIRGRECYFKYLQIIINKNKKKISDDDRAWIIWAINRLIFRANKNSQEWIIWADFDIWDWIKINMHLTPDLLDFRLREIYDKII